MSPLDTIGAPMTVLENLLSIFWLPIVLDESSVSHACWWLACEGKKSLTE
ncbi:hypothetical protein Hanom_Chr17g01540501 [Helianthus anomalus]